MSKVIACGDVMEGCQGELRAGSEEELMPLIVEHASAVHGINEIDAATAEKVKAAIRDE